MSEASVADSRPLPRLTLVLGGARSGKSRYAESLVAGHLHALPAAGRAVYIATAAPGDDEMAERIAVHQARRGENWRTVEVLLDLPTAVAENAITGAPVLIDCLTLWLSNLVHADADIGGETARLIEAFDEADGPVVCVANEVGLGIVPNSSLGRRFRDEAGRLNQRVAAAAARVDFVAAGLPLTMKDVT